MFLKAYASAKINLGLEIVSKREDGYHNLDTIMQSISLYDILYLEKTFNHNKISIKYENPISWKIKEDIIYKCAYDFLKKINQTNQGLNIKVKKFIPVGAGLGGGSSDGAAILLMLNKMYNNILSQNDLINIGEKIGSDIPFCMVGGTKRAYEKGNILKNIEFNNFKRFFIVLVKPDISINTKEAYNNLGNLKNNNDIKNFDILEKEIIDLNFKNLSTEMYNRFESSIDKNVVYEIKKLLIEKEAISSLMSGSGPSVYGVFEDIYIAKKCFFSLKKSYKQVFLCVPINYGVKLCN